MTFETIPQRWQTDHLFVLVGGNPLPNYVAGKLLLKEGGILHLVHSRETKDMATKIAVYFTGAMTHEILDPAKEGDIRQTLEDAWGKCESGSIGLNYTGGTKAMAVHAHQMMNNPKEKRDPCVCTYLDAQTLSLRRDGTADLSISVQFATRPEIKTLLALHGIELRHAPRTQPRRERLNQALATAHTTEAGQAAYESWCQRYLRRPKNKLVEGQAKAAIDDIIAMIGTEAAEQPHAQVLMRLRDSPCCAGDLVKKPSELPQNPIPLPDHPSLNDVASAMREVFKIEGATLDPTATLRTTEEEGFNDFADFIHYLDGDWLEHLTLAAFLANQTDSTKPTGRRLHDCSMSLRTTDSPYDFEFDVAAMQGYQLYAVSCTRSADRKLTKSKLFEAYVRARQIGGDEAKVGLVCCDKAPDVLADQVQRLWGTEKRRIRVFGPREIPNLPSHFNDWLSGKEKRS